jgi:hypothetical protein
MNAAALKLFQDRLRVLIERGGKIPGGASIYSVDGGTFEGWSVQVEHLLIEFLGSDHIYYERFLGAVQPREGGPNTFQRAEAIHILLGAFEDSQNGMLLGVQRIIEAEVFSDFLDMADHLLENGYKDAAASIVGAVLERELKDFATRNGLDVKARDDLSNLNNRLAEKRVYTRIIQAQVQVWIRIRNSADHGEFELYGIDDVKKMHGDVRDFLARFM